MIFVTIGTHHQSFVRLLKAVDTYAITTGEEIIVQAGFTEYIPVSKTMHLKKLISPTDMAHYINTADIVISHGGPATYMQALVAETPVIVVPRLAKFDEHVNDHQLDFAQKINAKSNYNLTVITDMADLHAALSHAKTAPKFKSQNANFNHQFQQILERYI